MSLLFVQTGILTTLQDLGRNGYRQFGINPNGAMDKPAVRILNALLGNPESEGVLEIHFPAPKILFERNAQIAIGGADFAAKINQNSIENWRPVQIKENTLLTFERKKRGARLYLAVLGGFKIEKWLESASTNLKAKAGGFEGRALQKGDRLFLNEDFRDSKFENRDSALKYKISPQMLPSYSNSPKIRVIAGREWQNLTKESQSLFLQETFSIRPDSDRMGYRLKGYPLQLRESFELVSSAVNFGTIQLLPGGEVIILMADHQTTGGYPRLAHVATQDLPVLAQLSANDQIGFELISLAEAEDLILQFEKKINWLKIGCRLKGYAKN
jgi:antagonist of KipI